MSKCLNCRRDCQVMVQLLCDHDLCFHCAQKIKVPQGVSPLDAKFKICCPSCKKNTTTLNIQNLVNQEHQKLLFVNVQSSELSQDEFQQPYQHAASNKLSESKLRKMSYTQRRTNINADRKTPQITQRASKPSYDSRRNQGTRSRQNQPVYEVKCQKHREALMFFCQQQNAVMCMQCMYKHMKQQKSHFVCSINDAIGNIVTCNKGYKMQAQKKIEEIEKCIVVCKNNQDKIQQAYTVHQELINHEFRQLEAMIKNGEAVARAYLLMVFQRKEKELGQHMEDLNQLKNCLKDHYEYALQSASAQLYFFNSYNLMKGAIKKVTGSSKVFKKEDLTCFDKLTSIEDFAVLLQKLFKPKPQGRESKAARKQSNAPSRSSETGAKIKQQLLQQTKRKLDKLNKMQSEHRQGKVCDQKEDYLNNFFIEEISKKELQGNLYHAERGSAVGNVPYRKSSASQMCNDRKVPHKALTPTRMLVSTHNSKGKKKL